MIRRDPNAEPRRPPRGALRTTGPTVERCHETAEQLMLPCRGLSRVASSGRRAEQWCPSRRVGVPLEKVENEGWPE